MGMCRFYCVFTLPLSRRLSVPPSLALSERNRTQTCMNLLGVYNMNATLPLSGPVRDTLPNRAIPFRDSIAEGGIAPICLVFIGYRASIAEILLRVGYRTSTSHALQGGNAQRRGGGIVPNWPC